MDAPTRKVGGLLMCVFGLKLRQCFSKFCPHRFSLLACVHVPRTNESLAISKKNHQINHLILDPKGQMARFSLSFVLAPEPERAYSSSAAVCPAQSDLTQTLLNNNSTAHRLVGFSMKMAHSNNCCLTKPVQGRTELD